MIAMAQVFSVDEINAAAKYFSKPQADGRLQQP